MTYRAKHVTQKDGSAKQWENCRMAVSATHLDFHTNGAKTSTGAQMRARQQDQVGGTDAYDAQRAWNTYDETLVIRNGKYWADLLRDRARGWFIALDVWYALLPDRCQKSATFGHNLGIAPETNSAGLWLVSDPLCDAYKWVDPMHLRIAAEDWGRRLNIGKALAYTTAVQVAEVEEVEPVPVSEPGQALGTITLSNGDGLFETPDDATKLRAVDAGDPRKVPALFRSGAWLAIGIPSESTPPARLVYVKRAEVDVTRPDQTICPDPSDIIAQRDAEWTAHLTPPLPTKTP